VLLVGLSDSVGIGAGISTQATSAVKPIRDRIKSRNTFMLVLLKIKTLDAKKPSLYWSKTVGYC
jgi:hypothetical protein